ncbi:hypothetical protein [Bacilliculturomica massiliensis]|uniref:hypothetical protein n=1 Tax=Bacilliculturomica massiliensis TaxID=1917867 RepID=UPI00102F6E28|nr:hypothetical protein [Bacilliculturomica massiliensis]
MIAGGINASNRISYVVLFRYEFEEGDKKINVTDILNGLKLEKNSETVFFINENTIGIAAVSLGQKTEPLLVIISIEDESIRNVLRIDLQDEEIAFPAKISRWNDYWQIFYYGTPDENGDKIAVVRIEEEWLLDDYTYVK